jgi:hypothetical protein
MHHNHPAAQGGTVKTDDQDLQVRYYRMTFDDLEGCFVVAKLRRVSSPPVLEGSVADPHASALARLIDIFRLGTKSRNYADLRAINRRLLRVFGVTTEQEWGDYLREIYRVHGDLNVIRPFLLTPQLGQPVVRVIFHNAQMAEKPYLVARMGDIMGSPAPIWLTFSKERESALARLGDVFKIGVRGQAFRDFVESGHTKGRIEDESLKQWRAWEQAVAWGN